MTDNSIAKQIEGDSDFILDSGVQERQSFLPAAEKQHSKRRRFFHIVAFSFVALVLLQVLLALSFKFAQRELSGQYPFSSPALLVIAEFTKLGISLLLFVQEQFHVRAVNNHGTEDKLLKRVAHSTSQTFPRLKEQLSFRLLRNTALLAALYCINNHIAFLVFRLADGANITLIKSGSSFVSALMLRFALGRTISRVQWSAILLQIFGLVVAQFGATCSDTPILPGYAYLLLLVSLTISSLSGVCNDQMLKSDNGVSMHVINMLLYALGFMMNGTSYIYIADPERRFFSGFDKSSTYYVLLCQSLFGVTISAVYKYSDATVKTFALSCATSILMVVNVLEFGSPFSLVAAMGCSTVFVATHLYVSNPPLGAAAAFKDLKALSVRDEFHKRIDDEDEEED